MSVTFIFKKEPLPLPLTLPLISNFSFGKTSPTPRLPRKEPEVPKKSPLNVVKVESPI